MQDAGNIGAVEGAGRDRDKQLGSIESTTGTTEMTKTVEGVKEHATEESTANDSPEADRHGEVGITVEDDEVVDSTVEALSASEGKKTRKKSFGRRTKSPDASARRKKKRKSQNTTNGFAMNDWLLL